VGLANLGSESETCVGSRVHLVGVSISFDKNFYRIPLSGSPYRSFTKFHCGVFVRLSVQRGQTSVGGPDSPPGDHGLSARHRFIAGCPGTRCRPSVIQGALLEVLSPFSDRPPEGCGLSALCLRTVRPGLADCPPGDLYDRQVICFLSRASSSGLFGFVSRVGRSVVTT
jgi:hypothetical protein